MKFKLIFLTVILLFSKNTFSQCESVTVKSTNNFTAFKLETLVESDGLRNGPDYNDATLFFPTNGNKNLKSIVLAPGYLRTQSTVTAWAKYLASRGFLRMTINMNSITDNPKLRAAALIDGMETIRQENNRKSSPLYGKIDINNIAVGGWSMGGGGAQLAATIDNRIKTVIAFAPWLDKSITFSSDSKQVSSVLIISGQNDPIASPDQHSDLHYKNTPDSTSKLLMEISGGRHRTPLNPKVGNGVVGNIAFAWLKVFLDGNKCYRKILNDKSLNKNSAISKYLTNLN